MVRKNNFLLDPSSLSNMVVSSVAFSYYNLQVGYLVGSKNLKQPLPMCENYKPSSYILVAYFLAYISIYVTYEEPT
jgi:hypothetical protein